MTLTDSKKLPTYILKTIMEIQKMRQSRMKQQTAPQNNKQN